MGKNEIYFSVILKSTTLTLIWVSFLEVCEGGGGGGITTCLKLVRIMPKTWNLGREYTPLYNFRKYTFSTNVHLILLVLVFFMQRINIIWQK